MLVGGLDPVLILVYILESFVNCILTRVGQFSEETPEKFVKSPGELIVKAAEANKEKGSSTLVICSLDSSEKKIYSAMIGDSGFMILRRQASTLEVLFRTTEQQHEFNFPFQIGTNGDNPRKAMVYSQDIQTGDFVVLGTDGLFDNVFTEDIRKLVESKMNESSNEIASSIAQLAFRMSKQSDYNSPFAQSAKSYGYRFNGGKEDDITVIVAKLVEQ